MSETKRGVSFWLKNLDTGTCNAGIAFLVNTSAGNRHVQFFASAGTNTYYTTGYYVIYMGAVPANTWHRGEYDIQQLLTTLTPGVTFNEVVDCYVYGKSIRLDDLRFSNSITVEHNIFGGGVVGHILHNRSINPTSNAVTDRWFHYDQVGSVISESNTAGTLAQTHHQDAFGNTQAAWNTGLWGGDRAGWHHNSKEYDIDIGAVYMYQRWYSAETGTFMSSAPYRVMLEHRYNFVKQNPVSYIDSDGRRVFKVNDGVHKGIIVADFENGQWCRFDFALASYVNGGGGDGSCSNSSGCSIDTTVSSGGSSLECGTSGSSGSGSSSGGGTFRGPGYVTKRCVPMSEGPAALLNNDQTMDQIWNPGGTSYTPDQSQDVLDYLDPTEDNPPLYDLINNNCRDCVQDAINAGAQ